MHISHFKIWRVSQPCAHVTVDALSTIISLNTWIITGQRDVYFACGIFDWAIPRPWSSRSSNIDVRQTSITSHLTNFFWRGPWQALKGKRGRGGGKFWRSGMGWRAPDFRSSPFSLSTPARRLTEAHLLSRNAVRSCAWRKKYSYVRDYVVWYVTVLCAVTQRFFRLGRRRVVRQREKWPNYRRNFYLPLSLLRYDSQMYE